MSEPPKLGYITPSNHNVGVKTKKRERHQFASLDELLSLPFVAEFVAKADPDDGVEFYRFSKSNHGSIGLGLEDMLIAEYNEGANMLVVGYIENSELVKELPLYELPGL